MTSMGSLLRPVIIIIFNFWSSIFTAPPEITVEKSWVHAAEGYDVELVCIVHGDVNSEVKVFKLKV